MGTLHAFISLIFMTTLPSEYHSHHFIDGGTETQGGQSHTTLNDRSGIPIQILMLQVWFEAQAINPVPRYLRGSCHFYFSILLPQEGKKG